MTVHNTVHNAQYSVHNGEWGYEWRGQEERGLPKFECVYCGSGDYILSARPSRLPMAEELVRTTIGTDCQVTEPEIVPEPFTAGMVVVAMVVGMVWTRTRTTAGQVNKSTGRG